MIASLLLAAQLVIIGASNSYDVAGFPPLEDYEPFWVDLVQEKQRDPIINLAVPGATTWHWARWLVFFAPYYRANIPQGSTVLLELGTNDHHLGVDPGPASGEEYELRMFFILDWLIAHGVHQVVLATPPPLGIASYPDQTLLEDYAMVIAQLCVALAQVECGPDLLHELDAVFHINSDDVHYSREGNARVAWLWLRWLRQNR